jgi:hypothetical protein
MHPLSLPTHFVLQQLVTQWHMVNYVTWCVFDLHSMYEAAPIAFLSSSPCTSTICHYNVGRAFLQHTLRYHWVCYSSLNKAYMVCPQTAEYTKYEAIKKYQWLESGLMVLP